MPPQFTTTSRVASLRTYWQASELKQAGLDWHQAVLSRFLTGAALVVARLKADRTFASEAARARAFVQSGAGCRASFARDSPRPAIPLGVRFGPDGNFYVTSYQTNAVLRYQGLSQCEHDPQQGRYWIAQHDGQ